MSDSTCGLSASLVDVCYSDYLQDGHTRDGEWLLCCSLGGTPEELADAMVDQSNGEAPPPSWEAAFPNGGPTDDVIKRCILEAMEGADVRPVDENGNHVDAVDEDDNEDNEDNEQPNVYVVLTWDVPEDK